MNSHFVWKNYSNAIGWKIDLEMTHSAFMLSTADSTLIMVHML